MSENKMIDDFSINDAREYIKSLLGKNVSFLVKEVHRSVMINKEGTVVAVYDKIFIINQKVSKFYSENKTYSYTDYLTGRIQFK